MTDPSRDSSVVFEVARGDFHETRFVESPVPRPAADGQVLLRVDRFALTANNVSYALTGDMLAYWSFFPAEGGFGRVPAMGFADVVESRHPEVKAGERFFGFYPMGSHLLVEAAEATRGSFVDVAAHRRDTALAYRQYLRSTADPMHEASREDAILLLRGLFLTSFLVNDFLLDNGGFGAERVFISSASSKTAIALAFCLSRRKGGRAIGLTSERNLAFCRGLGCFDEVLPYDAIDGIEPATPAVFVDHSGDRKVVGGVHRRLGDALRHSAVVGATHWSEKRPERDLPGPAPAFFFAPSQLEKRRAEWGPEGFERKLGESWREFLGFSDRWLRVVHGRGRADVERAWGEVLDGRAKPEEGHVLSLADRVG
ncbi:MAG: DUF2855 family protein [Alphaproteobacteria bacterium]